MTWPRGLAAVIFIALSPIGASARSISFIDGPAPENDTVTAWGKISLDAGDTILSVIMYVTNPKGGQGGEVECKYTKTTWRGTVSGLPAGTYSVYTRMRTVRPGEQDQYTDTRWVESITVSGPD